VRDTVDAYKWEHWSAWLHAINCADRVRELITIVPQEGRPLRALTPWDHVYNWLQIRGEYKDEARRRAREMLEKLEL